MVDLLLRIIIYIVTIFDTFLGYIVVNGNLTDVKGIQIVDSLASTINNLSAYFAQFTLILVNGTPS